MAGWLAFTLEAAYPYLSSFFKFLLFFTCYLLCGVYYRTIKDVILYYFMFLEMIVVLRGLC